jgi:hypothetical protein
MSDDLMGEDEAAAPVVRHEDYVCTDPDCPDLWPGLTHMHIPGPAWGAVDDPPCPP